MSLHSTPIPFSSSSAAEGLLETLLEVSLTGVIFFEPVYAADALSITDLNYLHLNPAAQRMLKLPQRPADTFLTLYPNALETGIFAFYRDTFLSHQAGRYNVNYSYNGLDNYFHLAARRSGDILVVSFTDTGDQDRSLVEVALRESQAREQAARATAEAERARLQEILMQLPAQVAINRGPDHVYTLVNPRYQQQFPMRTVEGQPVRKVLPELEGQQFFELLDKVYQTGEPFYGQAMPASVDYTNSGRMEVRYFDVFFQALRNAGGNIEGILNFAYDVTEQVHARQQVQQFNEELEARVQQRTGEVEIARAEAESERRRLHDILMQMPAQVAVNRGPDYIFELVNPRYQQLFPMRSIVGQPIRKALPELEGQQFFELLDKVYQTGETFYGQAMPALMDYTSSGQMEVRYFDVFFRALRNAGGSVDSLLNFAYDVTEQVQARLHVQQLNEELAAINEELQGANQELSGTNAQLTRTNMDLDNFIYTASHDLKAPISNIEGLMRMLKGKMEKEGWADPTINSVIDMMDASIIRFKQTVADLADISKVEKQLSEPWESVDIAGLISDILLDLRIPIEESNAQIEVHLEACSQIVFSKTNLKSVVYNLISNAIKYRDSIRKPHIIISCIEEEGYKVLSVADNGLGLNTSDENKIFGMFRRQHTHVEGTGVGLYIVKKIIENAGGKITVESKIGEGSIFRVYIKG